MYRIGRSGIDICAPYRQSSFESRSWTLTVRKLYASEGEIHDRGVLLLDKVVLGEPLDV